MPLLLIRSLGSLWTIPDAGSLLDEGSLRRTQNLVWGACLRKTVSPNLADTCSPCTCRNTEGDVKVHFGEQKISFGARASVRP